MCFERCVFLSFGIYFSPRELTKEASLKKSDATPTPPTSHWVTQRGVAQVGSHSTDCKLLPEIPSTALATYSLGLHSRQLFLFSGNGVFLHTAGLLLLVVTWTTQLQIHTEEDGHLHF